MEATEIAEQIHEPGHGGHHEGRRRPTGSASSPASISASSRCCSAIRLSLGGGSATKEMLSANIHASDTYAYYQAKTLRQVHYQIAADFLETAATGDPEKAAALAKRYRDTAAKYDSEPATGDGKKELLAKAHEWEARRDTAAARDPNFEFGEGLPADRDRYRLGQHRRGVTAVAFSIGPQRRGGHSAKSVALTLKRLSPARAARALVSTQRAQSRRKEREGIGEPARSAIPIPQ